jgi:hypothetical protein
MLVLGTVFSDTSTCSFWLLTRTSCTKLHARMNIVVESYLCTMLFRSWVVSYNRAALFPNISDRLSVILKVNNFTRLSLIHIDLSLSHSLCYLLVRSDGYVAFSKSCYLWSQCHTWCTEISASSLGLVGVKIVIKQFRPWALHSFGLLRTE